MAKSTLAYLRESLPAIWFTIGLFVASFLVAFLLPDHFSFFDNLLRELVSSIEGKSALEIVLFIFQNNFLSALLGMMLGMLLGLAPIMNALVNGSLIGYVLARAAENDGIGIAWRLLPHGIFELPAIFISLGLGIRLGAVLYSKFSLEEFKRRLEASVRVFLLVVVPLLVIAAFIEGLLIGFVK